MIEGINSTKKYWVIGISVIIILGLVVYGIYFYQIKKCEQRYENNDKIMLYNLICLSEGKFNSSESIFVRNAYCYNQSEQLAKKLNPFPPFEPGYSTKDFCFKHIKDRMVSDPLRIEFLNCSQIFIRSVVENLNDSSITIKDSCVYEMKQKYSDFLIKK